VRTLTVSAKKAEVAGFRCTGALIYEYQINVEHAPAFRDMRDFYIREIRFHRHRARRICRTTLSLAARSKTTVEERWRTIDRIRNGEQSLSRALIRFAEKARKPSTAGLGVKKAGISRIKFIRAAMLARFDLSSIRAKVPPRCLHRFRSQSRKRNRCRVADE